MSNFKDKTHSESKIIIAGLQSTEITRLIESGEQSAEDMAKVKGWSYDRLLYWLEQYGVINPRMLRIYGETDMQFERRKMREEGILQDALKVSDPQGVIQGRLDQLHRDNEAKTEEILRQRRELMSLTEKCDRATNRLARFEGGDFVARG